MVSKVQDPGAGEPPGSPTEMQNGKPHPRPTESESAFESPGDLFAY